MRESSTLLGNSREALKLDIDLRGVKGLSTISKAVWLSKFSISTFTIIRA
jgi:hypothetical protein